MKGMMKRGQESVEEIATIRIELAGSDPLIWREVEAPTSITFKTLHDIVQSVMNWDDSHLWEFTIAKQRFGPPLDDDWGETRAQDAGKVRLCEVLKPRKTVIDYLYDFGDSWEHRITVTKARPGEAGIAYPRYTGGEYNAPPEDCGGLPGFYNALEAMEDENHPDHDDVEDWFEDYDPNHIDVPAIKAALAYLSAQRTSRRRAGQQPGKSHPA
jgi:Plasmid pRiA4b ORF-3-like protein